MSWLNTEKNVERSSLMTVCACLVVLSGMLISGNALADVAGRLLFARGDVQILHTGEAPRKAGRGDSIEVGDSVQTGDKSNAQIRMSDGAMIALRAHTLFRVDQQTYHKDAPGEGSQAAQLLRGGMRAITGAIGHANPSAVSYKTPVATIGIRGTVIDVIYVPPEGIPGLPGVKPGLYTLVLKGQVNISNPAGEVTLAAGEIAYVSDAGTPPVLRPDLSWVFVQYASLTKSSGGEETSGEGSSEGEAGGSDSGGTGDTGDTGGGTPITVTEPTTVGVDNVLTQTASPTWTTKPGPYAVIAAYDDNLLTVYKSVFDTNVVSVGSSNELVSATGGTGDYSQFNNNSASPQSTGSVSAGDSTINWGSYALDAVSVYDSSGNPITTSSTSSTLNYMYATQVMTSVSDLPTTGTFTYNYAGGSGTALNSSSNLVVNFGSSTMDVNLYYGVASPLSYTASNQSISSFYNGGVTLDNATYGSGSTITGRFVGSNAEGAISNFELLFDGNLTGTAAFTR